MTTALRRPILAPLLLALTLSAPAWAQITVYDHPDFEGRSMTAQQANADLRRSRLNDRGSSVVVRGQRWEICNERQFQGRCRVLRPGQYPSLEAMGMDDQISSMRPLQRRRDRDEEQLSYAPHPLVSQDYRRRDRERLYDARVTQVRAVYGDPGQRCWMERGEATVEPRADNRVPGAVLGAVIGGILGHQVGGGSGRDIATVGGVVAGAAVGANLGRNRDGQTVVTRDVQRCRDNPRAAQPAYWDVDYEFRGQAHQMQMVTQPGGTIRVNREGEPRAG
jgi:uncharacterized protein YcfJ